MAGPRQNQGDAGVVLYDGSCRFCIAGAKRLERLARPGSIRLVSSSDPAALASVPEIDAASRERAIQFIGPDGRVSSGAEAVARSLNTRPVWRLVTWVYWVPVVRQFIDLAYRLVAANRHRIAGRIPTECESGACDVPRKRA